MERVKKSFVVGGYWNANFGDDLFLKVLVETFKNCDFVITVPPTKIGLYSKIAPNLNVEEEKIIDGNQLVTFINKVYRKFSGSLLGSADFRNLRKIRLKKADGYIELGGSIFILPKNGKLDSSYRFRNKIAAFDSTYFVIGSNFGPYYSDYQLRGYRHLFSNINGVTFRDKYSYSLFSNLNNVNYAPDVVFNLDISKYNIGEEYVTISIINPENRNFTTTQKTQYENYIVNIVKKYLKDNQKVILMAFCEAEGDTVFAEKISRTINSDGLRIHVHRDVEESLQIIANSKYIVATRFHAMILAWLMRKEVFVISYSEKTDHVIQDLFPEQSYVKVEELSDKTEMRYSRISKEILNNIVSDASNQFTNLNYYIKEINNG